MCLWTDEASKCQVRPSWHEKGKKWGSPRPEIDPINYIHCSMTSLVVHNHWKYRNGSTVELSCWADLAPPSAGKTKACTAMSFSLFSLNFIQKLLVVIVSINFFWKFELFRTKRSPINWWQYITKRIASPSLSTTNRCSFLLEPSCCKKWQEKSQPRNWFREVGLSEGFEWYQIDPPTHLGPTWYHLEPSDVPYSPNQFLGWDFFCRFLRQDSSKSF